MEGILGLARQRDVHPHVAAWMVVEEADEIDLPDALWTLQKITDLGSRAILVGLEERIDALRADLARPTACG